MGNKGQITREAIIEKAAELFNVRGYASGSMSELMKLTGLKKGGIYNHFQNKEELAVEAFKYSMNKIGEKVQQAFQDKKTATEKLEAIFEFYEKYALKPVIKGGCPILNTTVEADDTNPRLKEKVQKALMNSIKLLANLIEEGKANGEFHAFIHAEEAASVMIALIEGGIMMARTFNQNHYIEMMVRQLKQYLNAELKR